MLNFLKSALYWFFGLGVIFLPVSYFLLPDRNSVNRWLFGPIITWLSDLLFGVEGPDLNFYSDSISMFLLFILLAVLSIAIGLLSQFQILRWLADSTVRHVFQSLMIWFLAFQLFSYGIDKLFLGQFYTPFSNILMRPFGQLDRDILYWSVMGLSPIYSYFLGAMEVIGALLVLFYRTRVIGLYISFAMLLNIVMINFGFDISVKLVSSFLLALNLTLLFPHLKRLLYAVSTGIPLDLKDIDHLSKIVSNQSVKLSTRMIAIALLISEGMGLQLSQGFSKEKPELYAYDVVYAQPDTDFEAAVFLFIHPDGYLIYHDKLGHSKSVKIIMEKHESGIEFIVDKVEGNHYLIRDMSNEFIFTHDGSVLCSGKVHRLEDWPALQSKFHWFMEDVGTVAN